MREVIITLKRALQLSREDRLMFYRLLSAQMQAGIVPARACRSLIRLSGLPKGVRELARAAAEADSQSRPVSEGFARTGLIPPIESGLLTIAEKNGQLREAFDEIIEQGEDRQLQFFAAVIRPNIYYTVIVTMLFMFVWQADEFFAQIKLAATDNPLTKLSIALQIYLFPALGIAGSIALMIAYGMQRWIGPWRRILGPFDEQARLQFSIRFLDLAGMMARRGAANTSILEALIRVYGKARYLQHHARQALQKISGRGEEWESALAGGLVPVDHADLLRGLVPGGSREMYPAGYRTISIMQKQILRQRFQRIQVILKMMLLGTILYLLAALAEGMVSIFDTVQNL
ncbi:MAG: type II secretion system F family protein [Gammaproteobacteria bacterium]|nr:type II secretion system F family protein [Gammaproteobacteria bacterium]